MANKPVSVDFISKDFSSTLDALISFATTNFGPGTQSNRIWSNFNISSYERQWAELVAYASDLLFFYLDNQANEAYLSSATLRSSVLSIANQFGYSIPTASSASGIATFTTNGTATIPAGFNVSSTSGVNFFTVQSGSRSGAGTLDISVIQGTQVVDTFNAVGLQNEEFKLSNSELVIDTTNIVTSVRSPIVTVNGITWTKVNSFIESFPTSNHYIVGLADDGTATVMFGDGILGKSLTNGDVVQITYRTGGGSDGNIGANTLTSLSSTATNVISVNNAADFSGGTDALTIDQLRSLIPASLSTLERAVTEQDYADLTLLNFPQIAKVKATTANTQIGTDLNIYVVPVADTVTQITTNTNLLTSLNQFLRLRKMVTSQFKILDGFGLPLQIKLKIYVSQNNNQSIVETNVISALTNYLNFKTGTIDPAGTGPTFEQVIRLSDIYNVVEAVPGIDRFDILELNYQPRVESKATNINHLVFSEVETLPNSGRFEYLVVTETTPPNISGDPVGQYQIFQREYFKVSGVTDNSINDVNADFSVDSGNGVITASVIKDISHKVFVPGQYASGYLLVDSNNSIFRILGNTTNSITINLTPINLDGSAFQNGTYQIVRDLRDISEGGFKHSNLVFNNQIIAIKYNNANTIFTTPGTQLLDLGTLEDTFIVSTKLTLPPLSWTITSTTSFPVITGTGSLSTVEVGDVLIDQNGVTGVITAVDAVSNQVTLDINSIKPATGSASICAANECPIPVISTSINSTSQSGVFQLNTFLRGNQATIIPGDFLIDNLGVANEIQQTPYISFSNSGSTSYTYTSGTGVIQYGSAVDLSNVQVNDYFRDGANTDFQITAVNDGANTVTIATGQTVNTTSGVNAGGSLRSYARVKLVPGFTTPNFGTGGTLTRRYISPDSGVTWKASYNGQIANVGYTNINDLGLEPTSSSSADQFTIRTTPQVADITNIRSNEIPTIDISNINLDLRGGTI